MRHILPESTTARSPRPNPTLSRSAGEGAGGGGGGSLDFGFTFPENASRPPISEIPMKPGLSRFLQHGTPLALVIDRQRRRTKGGEGRREQISALEGISIFCEFRRATNNDVREEIRE